MTIDKTLVILIILAISVIGIATWILGLFGFVIAIIGIGAGILIWWIQNKEPTTEIEEVTSKKGKKIPIKIPPEKLLSDKERWKRIIYFATMISIIPIITVLILKTIAEWIFGLMATASGTEIPDGFSFGGAILAVWIILWIVIAAIEIKITVEKATGIVLVETSTVAIIEMIGGYSFTAKYKAHGKIKLIDRIFCFYYPFEKCRIILPEARLSPGEKPSKRCLLSIKEEVLDMKEQKVTTKDQVTLPIDAYITGFIFDSQKAVYGIDDFYVAIEKLTTSALRAESGDTILDKLISTKGRKFIEEAIAKVLQGITDRWGYTVTDTRIEFVHIPEKVQEAMDKVAIAEREKRALITKSKGEKQQKILLAEGGKRQIELLAAARRTELMEERRGLAATGLEEKDDQIDISKVTPGHVTTIEYVEKTLPKMADGQATKMLYPLETTGITNLVGQAVETMEFVKGSTGASRPIEKAKVESEETEENKGEEKKKEKEEE
jgi:regulator of protease activity HflC (stomatin/prohibitin superfamily)